MKKTNTTYLVLFALYVLWMGVGVFPLVNFETDSPCTLMGVQIMLNNGLELPPPIAYAYDMQPAVSYLLYGAAKLLWFWNVEQIYLLLCALSTVVFVVLSVQLVSELTGIRKEVILLAFFFLPETAAIATVPSTAIFAVLLLVAGLLCLNRKRYIVTVFLLGIAPLFRLDVLMVYPVVLLLLMQQGETFGRAVWKSGCIAVGVVGLTYGGYCLMGGNPLSIFSSWQSNAESGAYASHVGAVVLVFYYIVNFVLMPIGLLLLLKRKQILLFLLTLLPLLIVHYVMRNTGSAAKHYLYLLPFIAVATSTAIVWIHEKMSGRKTLAMALCIILTLLMTISVRVDDPVRPWKNVPTADEKKVGPFVPLVKEPWTKYGMEIGVGAGQMVPTADEMMTLGGHVFYPWFVHEYKKAQDQRREETWNCLRKESSYTLIGFNWGASFYLQRRYLEQGYEYKEGGEREQPCSVHYTLRKGGSVIEYLTVETNDSEQIQGVIEQMKKEKPGGKFFLLAMTERSQWILDQFVAEEKLVKRTDNLYETR